MRSSTATQGAAAGPSSNRRTSGRAQRTTTTRPQNYYARPFPGRGSTLDSVNEGSRHNGEAKFCPAITHFTDAITALPKEVMRHNTLLKEVEAKAHFPDEELASLCEKIARLPPTTVKSQQPASAIGTLKHSVNGSFSGPATQNGITPNDQSRAADLSTSQQSQPTPAEMERRHLYWNMAHVLAQMAPILDEKTAVLIDANKTLSRQLARMDSSYPAIDSEIREEARLGSLTHWAYADKEEKKKGSTANERTRREVQNANSLAAAAERAAMQETEAAMRSESRREAMLAKKRERANHHQHIDSDFDDPRPVTKKGHAKGARKAAEAAANDAKAYGLGITSNTTGTKRRKTEKAGPMAPAMERTLSAVSNTGRGGASPRETPVAEMSKKRKAPAAVATGARKRAQAMPSPAMASSPLHTGFPSSAKDAPSAMKEALSGNLSRPTSSRARQNSAANSIHSTLGIEAAASSKATAARPSSSASNKPPAVVTPAVGNGMASFAQELEQAAALAGSAPPSTRLPPTTLTIVSRKSTPAAGTPAEAPTTGGDKAMKKEDIEDNHSESGAPTPAIPPSLAREVVTTRAGRASKTGTPVAGTFPADAQPMARQRSTRRGNDGGSHASSESGTATKPKSHKKGAAAAERAAAAKKAEKDTPADSRRTASRKQSPSSPPSPTSSVSNPENADPKSPPHSPLSPPKPDIEALSDISAVADQPADPGNDDDEDLDPEIADAEDEPGDGEADEDEEDEERYCYCNGVSYGDMIACDNDGCQRQWFHYVCAGISRAPGGKAKWYCKDCQELKKQGKIR